MKKTLSYLLMVVLVSSCGSSDIVVTSDLGEKLIIKKSAVSVGKWTSAEAKKEISETYNINYNECKGRLDANDCWEIFGAGVTEEQNKNKILGDFASKNLYFTTVTYRGISVDLNGKKTADSKYTTIYCVPKTLTQEQKNLLLQVARYSDTVDIGTQSDNSILTTAENQLCDTYR